MLTVHQTHEHYSSKRRKKILRVRQWDTNQTSQENKKRLDFTHVLQLK